MGCVSSSPKDPENSRGDSYKEGQVVQEEVSAPFYTQAPGSSQNKVLIFPEPAGRSRSHNTLKQFIAELSRARVTMDIQLCSGISQEVVKALVSAGAKRGVILRILTSCSEDESIRSLLVGLSGTQCSAKGLQLDRSTLVDVNQSFVIIDGHVVVVGPADLTTEGLRTKLQLAVVSSDQRVVAPLLTQFQCTWSCKSR